MSTDRDASQNEHLNVMNRAAQRHRAKAELEVKLLEGLQGPAAEMTNEDWHSLEREARHRFDREQVGS